MFNALIEHLQRLVHDADLSGHAFRKNTAGAWGPDLARKLSQLVKMEKNVMRSMELVARERMETAVCGHLRSRWSLFKGKTDLC